MVRFPAPRGHRRRPRRRLIGLCGVPKRDFRTQRQPWHNNNPCGACAPFFTVPAVPAAKRRGPAPHYFPCLRRLRRQRGCLRSSIHNVSPSRSDDGNDDDDVLVAGLLMMIACGDGDGGVSHPFLWSGSDMYERTQHFLMLTPWSRRARGRSLRQRSGCRRVAQASGPW